MKETAVRIFSTRLGWMALLFTEDGGAVRWLTFGHATAAKAEADLRKKSDFPNVQHPAEPGKAEPRKNGAIDRLVSRLQAYAAGAVDDFADVRVDFGPVSDFQRRVLNHCRQLPYGTTASYAELASRSGHPGAARAVGSSMAANRVPLIVPCHRVVRADGQLGDYSAPGGCRTKRRLLDLERAGIADG
jgi:methylated-DNA-[protein]-cysteine S-methyltransferase